MDAGADGAFGNQTKEVVIEFQKQNGLEVTESISKSDYDLLMSGNAKKAPKKRIIVAWRLNNGWICKRFKKDCAKLKNIYFWLCGKQTGFIMGKLDLA